MKIALIHETDIAAEYIDFVATFTEQTNRELLIVDHAEDDMEQFCEENGIDIIFIYCRNNRKEVQTWLNRCRDLRLPYVFLTDTMKHLRPLKTVLTPVTMLEEEVYKAEILTHLSRFTGANIVLLRANDYGSRAEQNKNKIVTALEKQDITSATVVAKKDSFAVAKEAAERQQEWQTDLLLLTASREYGLDDILFGSTERYVVRHSKCPVMLLNPRGDLFSLCD